MGAWEQVNSKSTIDLDKCNSVGLCSKRPILEMNQKFYQILSRNFQRLLIDSTCQINLVLLNHFEILPS